MIYSPNDNNPNKESPTPHPQEPTFCLLNGRTSGGHTGEDRRRLNHHAPARTYAYMPAWQLASFAHIYFACIHQVGLTSLISFSWDDRTLFVQHPQRHTLGSFLRPTTDLGVGDLPPVAPRSPAVGGGFLLVIVPGASP